MLFHSRAHRQALAASGIRNGMRILEVAIGSGEMFHRLLQVNRDGETVGVDLSPNMAARTQSRVRAAFPSSNAHCHAADARNLPFPDASFDAIVCCYLFELLSEDDMTNALAEFRRVLRQEGRLTTILICQSLTAFNAMYKVCTKLAPAFWGRQIEKRLPRMLSLQGFSIRGDHNVRQIFYPSRIIVAAASNGHSSHKY
jgi:ubiquinone/menaquinone biosynthesis C-methylase UbiE